ncbi:MAG: response regulator [Polyangiales bacterium]
MTRELWLVEDSDDDYELFVRTCKSVGFTGTVRRFSDGDEALAQLRTFDWVHTPKERLPALLLLDLNLPGMDGRELLEILKQDPRLKLLPVVVYTTSSNESDIAFCYQHHANGYQLKAMDVDRQEADVRSLVDYWFTRVVSPLSVATKINA